MAGERIFDGRVSVEEILRRWQRDSNLVTLSRCWAAPGTAIGGEGHAGLARALLQAGARSLLVSLWEVDDQAAALLMGRFYENLTGAYREKRNGRAGRRIPPADALREAKLWLRTYTDSVGRQPFEHPRYWAAFVLIGDND
jgi:CHAT domain-containing protein